MAPGPLRVAYLLGAGATQGAVSHKKCAHGTLMGHMAESLVAQLRQAVAIGFPGKPALESLVNDAVDEDTDFEHLITFLSQSPSADHQKLAENAREAFYSTLRARFDQVGAEVGRLEDGLFDALVSLHASIGTREVLKGFLTLNYDSYLEEAIERTAAFQVDYGVEVTPAGVGSGTRVAVIKLHGSFDWRDVWPIERASGQDDSLWIPPGIHKAKSRYPFNVLWGRAMEVLDCEVLRIVGCKLGANDWDLISLLFSARFAHSSRPPFLIEVINAPAEAERMKKSFPYLDVRSILELDILGPRLVSEIGGGSVRPVEALGDTEREELFKKCEAPLNWLWLWLTQYAEHLYEESAFTDGDGSAIIAMLRG